LTLKNFPALNCFDKYVGQSHLLPARICTYFIKEKREMGFGKKKSGLSQVNAWIKAKSRKSMREKEFLSMIFLKEKKLF